MTPDTTEGAEPAQKKESALSFLIGENDTESNGNMEVDRFLREPVINSEENSLEWWKRNQERLYSQTCTEIPLHSSYFCTSRESFPQLDW